MNDSEERRILSRNLRKFMEVQNVDRNKLCEVLDVSYTSVTEWIHGETYPRADKITKLANFFGVPKSALVDDQDNKGIPILGRIPAGIPFEAVQEQYTIDHVMPPLNWHHNVNNYFALIVVGDSMEDEYSDGDIVIFKKETTDFNGRDCCVIIDNDDATFKKVTKTDDGILLEPLNIHNSTHFLPTPYSAQECVDKSIRVIGVAEYKFGRTKIKN